MKKIVVIGLLFVAIILTGCDNSHNFMDVDNPNAKDDLMNLIGSGNISDINTDEFIPDNLSGARNTVKGYANQYYEDTFDEYIGKAKESLSGVSNNLKGYYNDGVDELNQMVSDKVNGVISGELSKFKIK